LPGRERLRAAAGAGDEQRLLDLEEEVAALVGRRAVDAEPDADAGVEELAQRRHAGAESHVRARAVRDADVLPAELRHVGRREVHAMCTPDVLREPPELLDVLDGCATELLLRELRFLNGF